VDLGCGSEGLDAALPSEITVVGIDINRDLLLRYVARPAQAVMATAERLPFRSHSTDAMTAMSIVEHIGDQESFFREIARVLRPGGVLVLQFPELRFPIEPHTKWPFLYLVRKPLQEQILEATGAADLNFRTSLDGIGRAATSAGLWIQRVRPIWHARWGPLLGMPMGYLVDLQNGSGTIDPGATSEGT